MRIDNEAEQLSIYDLDLWCGKMCPEPSPAEPPKARTSGSSSRRSSELKSVVFQSLDLTPGAGNLLGEFYWELISPWRGDALTLNTGVSPREEKESSLSQILQDDPPDKYYLTRKACLGILRRAFERGKELPRKLNRALEIQSGVAPPDGRSTPLEAYHINQRDEGIDLHGVSGALMATNNMQMQTFIAGLPDQQKEPTLCLNDQGGQVMDCSVDVAGTLRAQMSGHPPLVFDNHGQDLRFTGPVEKAQAVTASYGMGGNTQSLVLFENHGIDGRYTGPLPVSPTLSARSGTGGNNLPLIAEEPGSYCIAGNIIDRQSKNGGNGFGYQEDISYTLNTTDRHAVYSRQRVDEFQESKVAGTESARQYKDATDLICQPEVNRNLIRRLTPLECERLQGFPDGWTLIDGASDSARYKALGNSVAIPCVTFVLRGIVLIMEKEFAEEQKNGIEDWRHNQ